jgi:chemotaxis-related protein WspD
MSMPVRSLAVVDCWNTIGVKGDRSCEKLRDAIHCQNCSVFAGAARAFLDRPAPVGYVEEVTQLLASSPQNVDASRKSIVVFELDGQALGIDTHCVVEVTEVRQVHGVGHRSGRFFSGLVNIHGQLELCGSLRKLLQISRENSKAAADSEGRMLLVEHVGRRWVFEADAVHGLQRYDESLVSNVPATNQHANSYLRAVIAWQDRGVGHLDLEKTFAALESSLR